MWAGDLEPHAHKEFLNYADCKVHKHAAIEDLKLGWWDNSSSCQSLLRIMALDPFLFSENYCKTHFINWAVHVGFLPKEGIIQNDCISPKTRLHIELFDTMAYHIHEMLQALSCLAANCNYSRNQFANHHRKYTELKYCKTVGEVVKCIENDPLFNILKSHSSDKISLEKKAISFSICYAIYFILSNEYSPSDKFIKENFTNEEEEIKKRGNQAYEKAHFALAVDYYTDITKSNKYNKIVYSNRAQAYIRQGKWHEAALDGRRAIVLQSFWCKGYSKLSLALEGEKRFHDGFHVAIFGQRQCKDQNSCKDWISLNQICARLHEKPNQDSNLKGGKPNITRDSAFIDVPELITDSDSDSSDFNQAPCDNKKSQYLAQNKSQKDSLKKEPVFASISRPVSVIPNLLDLIKKQKMACKDGSNFLLTKKGPEAIESYQKALEIIPLFQQQNYDIDISTLIVLKYALGIAHTHSGLGSSSEELKKALGLFEDIHKNHTDLFPAVYYGLSLTLTQMFRYDDARKQINKGIAVSKKITTFSTYNWPGTNIVIEETIPDKLKASLDNLISQSRSTDMICHFDDCLAEKKMYFSDPDYKGFFRIQCLANCCLNFHPQCFKTLQDKLKLKEKEFLNEMCVTPDCGEFVIAVYKIDKVGEIEKSFISESHPFKSDFKKQRKTKFERKFELKEIRKLKKRERVHKTSESEYLEEKDNGSEVGIQQETEVNNQNLRNIDSQQEPTDDTLQENPENESTVEKDNLETTSLTGPNYEVNSQPLYVIKKNDQSEVDTIENVDFKLSKRDRKKKKTVMSIEEFCGDVLTDPSIRNPHLKRLNRLQVDKTMVEEGRNIPNIKFPMLANSDNPFYIPGHLKNNMEDLEITLKSQFPVIGENKDMIDNFFSFMESILQGYGPLKITSKILVEESSYLPQETINIMNDNGGLINFLITNPNFKRVEDFVCLASDVAKAKSMCSSKPMHSFDDFEYQSDISEANRTGSDSDTSSSDESGVKSDIKQPKKVKIDFSRSKILNEECTLSTHISTKKTIDKAESKESKNVSYRDIVSQEAVTTSKNISNIQVTSSPQEDKALQNLRENASSLKNNLFQTAFKLQVSISVLSEDDQAELISGILSTVAKNSTQFWKTLNSKLKGVSASPDSHLQDNSLRQDLKRKLALDGQKSQETIRILEERLSFASDKIVRLQNTSAAVKKRLEEDKIECQEKCNFMENELKTAQMQFETDRKKINQERTKYIEEMKLYNRDKENQEISKKLLEDSIHENIILNDEIAKEKAQSNTLKISIEDLLTQIDAANSKHKNVQIYMIKTRQIEGFKILDQLINEANKEVKRIATALGHLISNNVSRDHTISLDLNMKEFLQYIKTLEEIRNKFHSENEIYLKKVDDFEIVALEELPSYDVPPKPSSKLPSVPLIPLPNNKHAPLFSIPPKNSLFKPGLLGTPPFYPLPPPPSSKFTNFVPNFPPYPRSASSMVPPTVSSMVPPTVLPTAPTASPTPGPTRPDLFPSLFSNSAAAGDMVSSAASSSAFYNKPDPINIFEKSISSNETIQTNPFDSFPSTSMEMIKIKKVPVKIFKTINQNCQNRSFEKLIILTKERFPMLSNAAIEGYVKRYRLQKQKLSGMTVDQIVEDVTIMISKERMTSHLSAKTSSAINIDSFETINRGPPKGWQKNEMGDDWKNKNNEDCIICFEPISQDQAFKGDCGHLFHKLCMHSWMANQSTCPICRKLILLPEEYPELGK